MTVLTSTGQSAPQSYLPSGSWYVSEVTFTTTLSNLDSIVFFSAPLLGYRIADWFLVSDQLDSNVSPTLTYSIGVLNSAATGIDTPLYSSWKTGSTLSNQPPWSSIEKPSNGFHLAFDSGTGVSGLGRNRGVGVLVTSGAATWVGTGKKLIMGINLIPA